MEEEEGEVGEGGSNGIRSAELRYPICRCVLIAPAVVIPPSTTGDILIRILDRDLQVPSRTVRDGSEFHVNFIPFLGIGVGYVDVVVVVVFDVRGLGDVDAQSGRAWHRTGALAAGLASANGGDV